MDHSGIKIRWREWKKRKQQVKRWSPIREQNVTLYEDIRDNVVFWLCMIILFVVIGLTH